jgi:hypothetical protein
MWIVERRDATLRPPFDESHDGGRTGHGELGAAACVIDHDQRVDNSVVPVNEHRVDGERPVGSAVYSDPQG